MTSKKADMWNLEKYLDSFSISHLICHRIPERTFKINNRYFPVCSRCTGIYIGFFLFFIQNYIFSLYLTPLFGFIMIIPMFIDGTTQFFGFRKSNNKLRLITGLIAGYGYGILIINVIN
jgi:uncharacterized membrane protein